MTNAELIAKIKAEVERLKDENNNIRCDSNKSYCQGYGDAFVDLLPFLYNLESEKPVSDDLEEAANKFAVFYDQGTCDGIAQDCFIAGAKWHKEQMMKEAVEGIVTTRSMAWNIVTAHVDYRYKDGQKVRIIIVKED